MSVDQAPYADEMRNYGQGICCFRHAVGDPLPADLAQTFAYYGVRRPAQTTDDYRFLGRITAHCIGCGWTGRPSSTAARAAAGGK